MCAATPTPTWFEPRLPAPKECSLGHILAERARRNPDESFITFDDGSIWTGAQTLSAVQSAARRLRALGLGPGQRLLIWLPNGPDMLRMIFAASTLGVCIVPLNVSLRGTLLANAVIGAEADVMVVHPSLLPRVAEIETGKVTKFIVPGKGPMAGAPSRGQTLCEDDVAEESGALEPFQYQPWDTAFIIYSSGTTGPSKGVMVPAAQLWSLGCVFYGFLRSDDRMLFMYPLFHIAALGALFGTMAAGATIAITEAFRASTFWDLVRRTGATSAPGLGRTFVDHLLKVPAQANDRDHSFRMVTVQSNNPAVRAFATRFGCDVIPSYSMTETSGIAVGDVNSPKDGSVGRCRKGLEVRIVDSNDVEVPMGTAGELVVRSNLPWVLNAGYFNDPAATVKAWRNGWFHTGDVLRRDADGDLFFVDRLKDVIRRRSENISASEVEAEVRQFPSVLDAAAIGVDTPDGEEVMIVVAPVEGKTVEPRALIEFLIPRMPHFMVPRFVRVLDALPKTHTNRVQKVELRQTGVTPDSWDREAEGLRLKRERL